MAVRTRPHHRRWPFPVPRDVCPVAATIAPHLPDRRPAQHLGLALWVCGTVSAGRVCQVAVVAAWLPRGAADQTRRHRRCQWRADGEDPAAPGHVELDVATGCAPVPRGVLVWWRGTALPLAIATTTWGDPLGVLTGSVLDRGCAGAGRGSGRGSGWSPRLAAS